MDKVQFPVIFGFREVAVGNDVFDARSGVQMSVVLYIKIMNTGLDKICADKNQWFRFKSLDEGL